MSDETLISLIELPAYTKARYGRQISRRTPFRWAETGLHGIKLETIQFGDTTCTSPRMFARFMEELTRTVGY